MSFLLGIDVGTSSTKSEVFDLNGRSLAVAQQEYPILSPRMGWAEEEPEAGWWSAIKKTVRAVLKISGINTEDVISICVSGTNACVPVGRNGRALMNAVMQLDTRSVRFADWILHVLGEDRVFQITGNRVASGTFIAPTILWIRENRPDIFDKTYKFMVPTGFATMKLTDEYTIDWSRCSTTLLFDIGTSKKWSDELCDALGIPIDKLPEPHISKDVVGEVTRKASRETGLASGTPVVAGCMDTVSAAVGSAIIDAGDTFYTLGTLGRLCYCLDEPKFDKRFINICHAIEGKWLAMGLMHGGGLSLRWFRDELGFLEVEKAKSVGKTPYEVIDEEVEESPPGSRGIIYLPYLSGERSPIWDSHAKGVLLGFTVMHRRSDLARAIEEGVAYSLRHNIEVFESMSFEVRKVRMGGGGAKSRVWRQIIADVIGKPVEVTENLSTETIGDALIAGMGVGVYNLDKVKDVVRIEGEVKPDMENHKLYTKLFDIYKKVYLHLKEDFAELNTALESGDYSTRRPAERI
ncbi:MAG: FGGY-family carbohydrate kinase [Candidatus Bathyarchaeia archaeon]